MYNIASDEYSYGISGVSPVNIGFDSVIMRVKLHFLEHGTFSLDESDKKVLQEFEDNIAKRAHKRNNKSQTTERRAVSRVPSHSAVAADGRVVVVSRADAENDQNENFRRSQRMRRLILYEAE